MNHFYKEDLAYVHHVGYDEFSKRAGRELLELFRSCGLDAGTVIDLGCGTGHWAKMLTDEGYTVYGFDISDAMIRMARRTSPHAEFAVASLNDIEFRSCSAVTALGEVLNYRVDDEPSYEILAERFKKISEHLQEGGIFAFDIITQSDGEGMQYQTWKKGNDWAVLMGVSEDIDRGEIKREITVFREVDGHYRRSEEVHQVRVLDEEKVKQLLIDAGLDVRVSTSYGSYRLAPRRTAFIARKLP